MNFAHVFPLMVSLTWFNGHQWTISIISNSSNSTVLFIHLDSMIDLSVSSIWPLGSRVRVTCRWKFSNFIISSSSTDRAESDPISTNTSSLRFWVILWGQNDRCVRVVVVMQTFAMRPSICLSYFSSRRNVLKRVRIQHFQLLVGCSNVCDESTQTKLNTNSLNWI